MRKWNSIRSVGNSQIVRASILVPVIGYILLYGSAFREWFSFVNEISEATSLNSNSWIEYFISISRFHMLYFSLVFLSIGSVIYQICCPKIIKNYRSPGEYFKEEGRSDLVFIISLLDEIRSGGNFSISERRFRNEVNELKEIYFKDNQISSPAGSLKKLGKIELKDYVNSTDVAFALMHIIYSWRDTQSPIARWASFSFFVVGFLLLFLNALQILMLVIISIRI